jgi:hypothetical protein
MKMYHVEAQFTVESMTLREAVVDKCESLIEWEQAVDAPWMDDDQIDQLSCHVTRQQLPTIVQFFVDTPELTDLTIKHFETGGFHWR